MIDGAIRIPHNNKIKRIIHLSDIHIRTGNHEQARYNEYLNVFNNLIERLGQYDNLHDSIIIITGDIFHHKNQIESSGIELFTYLIKELTNLTSVYIIMGNHDYRQDNVDDPDLLSALIKNSNYNNLHYLDKTGIYIVNNLLIGLVAINDILISGDTCGMVENLPEFPNPNNVDLSNVDYKVALYHGIIVDDDNKFFKDKGINSGWFNDYDYAILGDNHKQQINNINPSNSLHKFDLSKKIKENKAIWGYSGSLIQQNFGETISKHGYLLWNLEDKKATSVDIINNNSYCTFNFKNEKKNKEKEWFENIDDFKKFINENDYLKNINIRFLSNEKCINISDVINFLDEKDINYNKFYYNENLIKSNKKDSIDNVNQISSYSSPDKWYEYIETHVDNEIIEDYDWKNMLNNPENLQINTDIIPDILKNKVEDKNKKILKNLSKYTDSIDVDNKKKNVLKLEYMEWNWILCYDDDCWFNFKNMDTNVGLLSGLNGHGKSSFLEIICLALFGEPMPSRYNKQLSASIISQQKPKNSQSRLKLIFTIDNNKYMILRTFNYQKDVSKLLMKVELYDINGNNLVPFRSGVKAVRGWLIEHIGTLDTFLTSSMLTQSSDKDFFTMKYADQIVLLDDALSLGSIKLLVDLLKQTNLAYSNIMEGLEVQYLELNSSNIEEITKEQVDECKELMLSTKAKLEELQESSYKKLNEVNSYVNIENEKDLELDDETINKRIEEIIYKDDLFDINELYNERGSITTSIKNLLKFFKDYKIDHKNYKNYKNLNTANNSILWDVYSMYKSDDDEKHNENYNEFSLSNIEDLEAEYNKCSEYFEKNDNSKSIEKLEEINNNLMKESEDKKTEINNNKSELDKLKNYNSIYKSNINENLKEQNKLSNKIRATLEECTTSIEDYEKMKDKITKKKQLLKNNKELLDLLEKTNKDYCKLKEEIQSNEKSINEIKSNDYPFNPDCECCKAQPWKLHLTELEKKLDFNKEKLIELEAIFKENETSAKDYNKLKKKLENNINKFTKYINTYDDLRNKETFYKEQIDLIKSNKEYEDKIKKFENLELENRDKIKEIERTLNLLNKQFNKIEDKIETNNDEIKMKKEYDDWVKRKDINDADIRCYYWVSETKYNEYLNLLNKNKELDNKITEYNENIKNKELKEYWQNIVKVKPLWYEYNDMKQKISRKNNYYNNISNKYSNLRKEYSEYKKIIEKRENVEKSLNELKKLSKILEHFSDIFGNFRNWLYKNKIIPLIIHNTNDIINKISNNEKDALSIDVRWNENGTFNWIIDDGNNRPNIEKASGFQKFIISLGVKITLSNIGVSNLQCKQLFIDEGFTSCDKEHLSKVPLFINSLLSLYDSILLVSHLQQIKDSVSITMSIDRNIEKSISTLKYGNKINITQTKIEE